MNNNQNLQNQSPWNPAWLSRRDRAMLQLAIETDLRVSELTGLTPGDIHLTNPAHVACRGKGRKERITPLTRNTTAVVRAWLT